MAPISPRQDISKLKAGCFSAEPNSTHELTAAVLEQQPMEPGSVAPQIKKAANNGLALGNARMWTPRDVLRNIMVLPVGREY